MTANANNLGVRKVLIWSLVGVLGMFAFGFALVPLYDAMCRALGINGKTGDQYLGEVTEERIDRSRTLQVRFTSVKGPDMPWEFSADTRMIEVHPGEQHVIEYMAHNPTDKPMVAQAIPSLQPSNGARYFLKTECFCFEEQILQPGETVRMPLAFFVDDKIPESVYRITLNYTIYDITGRSGVAPVAASDTGDTKDQG